MSTTKLQFTQAILGFLVLCVNEEFDLQTVTNYLLQAFEAEDPEVFYGTSGDERYADFMLWQVYEGEDI